MRTIGILRTAALLLLASIATDGLARSRGDSPPPTSAHISLSTTATVSGDYTVSLSGSGSIRYYELEVNHDSSGWSSVPLSGYQTSVPYTGQSPGTYTYRAKACNYGGCSGFSSLRTVAVGPPTADTISPRGYVALTGDINNDGRADYFITSHSSESVLVSDFLLIQGFGGSFTVVANPSSSQVAQARIWSQIDGLLSGADLNFDGYLDFILSGIEVSTAGVEDVFVVTKKDNGTYPVVALPIDEDFLRIFEEALFALTEATAFNQIWNTVSCTTVEVPLFQIGCSVTDGFLSMESLGGLGGLCAVDNIFVDTTCTTGADKFAPEMAGIRSSLGPLINGGGVNCSSCIASGTAALGFGPAALPVVVAGSAVVGGVLASWGIATVSTADMPTDVGTIGDLFDEISAMLGGYFRKPLIDLTDAPTTDVWQLDSECRSRDPYFVNRASRGDSKILRENLKDAKCGCEEEYRKWSDAHHLVEKGDRMIDAQEILEDCGIGIDDAINGVCLPRYNVVVDHANSEALSHQQSGLTGGAYRRELTRRLQEARGNGAECDVEAVEEVLISYRDALLRGDFWEVFF